jgi:hypothetical protein
MGLEYGIKICRETLLKLAASVENIDDRMSDALSEITIIEADDASVEHFKQIKQLNGRYLLLDKNYEEKETELTEIAISLVWLCCEIIEHNTKSQPK